MSSNFNIFASYSTKDIEKIKPVLNNLLQIQGVQVFFADDDLKPGDIISRRITQNITASDIFLVFYSSSARQSSYVQQEIGVALGQNKIIIPLLLDETKPTGMLANVHYLDFSDEQKRLSEFTRLYNFIVTNKQTKDRNQLLGGLALLGIGIFALAASQNDDEDDNEDY
ncbi:toll/interleukin-1 receptor domain-containing protein [Methanoregula sp.]|uniref:toll/interleukin-1 receptor domain-containing protein n=1 Tax=Methanoregula sp. TaxID=2052170 RepID=UPI003BAF52A7